MDVNLNAKSAADICFGYITVFTVYALHGEYDRLCDFNKFKLY